MPYRRRKQNAGMTCMGKKVKTKRKTKDLDEIDSDMKPQSAERLLNQEIDLDVAGGGQHYCLHCARHFIDANALKEHFRGKPHKRRLKALETEPYTQEEADRAAGMGSYVAPKKRKIITQDSSTHNSHEIQDETIADGIDKEVSKTKKRRKT